MWNIDNHVLALMFVVFVIHRNRRRGECSGKRIAVHRSIIANVAKEREILLLFSVHMDVVLCLEMSTSSHK